MTIAALPPNTIRAIGSSQVLTDPASLVKELIDNSLDGRATAVFIEISFNALDIIQVKDNGHGIAPADRGMLCTRSCTSKIRGLDDLSTIGGKSLGFRGEALASAAEMSGSMTITTRVEGEATATNLKVNSQGVIDKEERVSHPVGTTIRVADFLKNFPVRRQAALKATGKLLSKIKRILQASALARPWIRFSLKVLKAKNDKGNWMYAPKTGVTTAALTTDAAVKVVGRKPIEQSKWMDWTSSFVVGQIEKSTTEAGRDELETGESYTVEALLPVPNCDIAAISNVGQFVSIDSRPVSCSRGTLKQIVSLYKSYVRSASSVCSGEKLADPFLYMNIVCPVGSYDANVEPAKDDVLFTDTALIIQIVGRFFESVYGELQIPAMGDIGSKTSKPKSQGFELLLARKQKPIVMDIPWRATEDCDRHMRGSNHASMANTRGALPESLPIISPQSFDTLSQLRPASATKSASPQTALVLEVPTAADHVLSTDQETSGDGRIGASNMYARDDEDLGSPYISPGSHHERSVHAESDEDSALRNINISNPWVFAKINAPTRPLRKEHETDTNIESNAQLLTPVRRVDDPAIGSHRPLETRQQCSGTTMRGLPSPTRSHAQSSSPATPSSPNPFPFPLKAWSNGEGGRVSRRARNSNEECNGIGRLDSWMQNRPDPHADASYPDTQENEDPLLSHDMASESPRDFVSARSLPLGTPLSAIPEAPPKRARKLGPRKQQDGAIAKPFVSPVNDPERVWFDMKPKRPGRSSRPARAEDSQAARSANSPVAPSSQDPGSVAATDGTAFVRTVDPELSQIMDYELRKQAANQKHKAYMRQEAATEKANRSNREENSCPKLPLTSPHKNRYNKAIAALHDAVDENSSKNLPKALNSPAAPSTFESGDPRAYLILVQQREAIDRELQRSTSGSSIVPVRSKRRKTSSLPLESTQRDHAVQDLILQIDNLTPPDLQSQVSKAGSYEHYIRHGKLAPAFSDPAPTIQDVRAWEESLRDLIKVRFRKATSTSSSRRREEDGDDDGDIRIDLWTVLNSHLSQHQ